MKPFLPQQPAGNKGYFSLHYSFFMNNAG